MIYCKRFDEASRDFWEYGAGAFLWKDLGGNRAMLLLSVTGTLVLLFTNRQANNWAAPGPVSAWDGNIEKPTLWPSIVDPMGWHGFLIEGALVDAPPSGFVPRLLG